MRRVLPERRANVIHAEGELQASEKLLAQQPQGMQLRYLQTLSNIAGDKSSTIVFPVPMDIVMVLANAKGSDAPEAWNGRMRPDRAVISVRLRELQRACDVK